MKNKRRNKVILLIILILGISIGFAALATTLKIKGATSIGKNTWNIYWDNIDNERGVDATTPAAIDQEDDTLITWGVTLNDPGDYYEFTIDAVNAGTLDAKIKEIVFKYGDDVIPIAADANHPSPAPSFLKFTVTYADGTIPKVDDSLAKKNGDTPTRKTFKVRVEYDANGITAESLSQISDTIGHIFSFSVKYGQDLSDHTPAQGRTFATDTWADIAQTGPAAATQEKANNGACGDYYHVGDTKTISFDINGDGTNEDFKVRIANCSTPTQCGITKYSQTSCGFVLEFVGVIDNYKMNPYITDSGDPRYNTAGTNNVGTWYSTEMRAYLNNGKYLADTENEIDFTNTGLYSRLPSDLKAVISDTFVTSSVGSLNSGVFTSTDKLFLLATREILGDNGKQDRITTDNSTLFTRQLDYYEQNNVTTNNYRGAIKTYIDGTPSNWWTRSATSANNTDFFYIQDTGHWNTVSSDGGSNPKKDGISPGFKVG